MEINVHCRGKEEEEGGAQSTVVYGHSPGTEERPGKVEGRRSCEGKTLQRMEYDRRFCEIGSGMVLSEMMMVRVERVSVG